MHSKDWRNLFDSGSISRPQQVIGDLHTVIFVNEDERVFGMGKGLAGAADSGWLREIKKPADCRDF